MPTTVAVTGMRDNQIMSPPRVTEKKAGRAKKRGGNGPVAKKGGPKTGGKNRHSSLITTTNRGRRDLDLRRSAEKPLESACRSHI